MGFFDDFRREWEQGDQPETAPEPETPRWLAAPHDELGGVVPVELLVASSDEAAVYVSHLAAYPSGFSFTLHVCNRGDREFDGFELIHGFGARRSAGLPDELLRFGIEFSDGRRAATFGESMGGIAFGMALGGDDEEPDPATEISLQPDGGGGGSRHYRTSYWVWPSPPDGPVHFVCEWPAFGIEESATDIEAEVIHGAAERSRPVWSD